MSRTSEPPDPDLLARLTGPWAQVARRVDAVFAQAMSAYPDEMACRAGCHECCEDGLTVMAVEAVALLEGLNTAGPPVPQAPSSGRVRSGCAMLVQGRCALYAGRPLICRTHGLPIRQERPTGGGLELGCCPLNFRRRIAGSFPSDVTVDAGWLTAALTVADGMMWRALDLTSHPPPRIEIRELARRGWRALPRDLRRRLF